MAKVFLSAGHGGSDPGAVANGLYEKTINLNVLLACKNELERHGVKVTCSRVKDENDPVNQEVKEANASGADIAVSFHINAGGGDGFEVYRHDSSNNGKRLAALCEKYVKALGQNSRGLKSGNHLRFVKGTSMTAVLVESFFIDNAKDKTIGDTITEQTSFGIAYAKAILEYLGVDYKTAAKKTVYRVQVGAYSDKANASEMKKRLTKAGFEAIIV
jgi:N-acetylmuramoyl-L-alanine amidase